MRAISHVPDNRRVWKWLYACLLAISPFLWGCSKSAEIPVVDFSMTVAVERPQPDPGETQMLRVAVGAMISPKETFIHYQELLTYMGSKIGMAPEFIQRKTYGEINELLDRGRIDLAFICSGPFATGRESFGFEPLAVPQTGGSHFYQSYLIVKNETLRSLEDLKGRSFAFTDPDSNTGKLVPTYWLAQMGESPERYFSRVIYTYSHDNSIMAVSRGLVDGAAVDSLIWEYYNSTNPAFTASTRVIKRSEHFPIPPIVASRFLSEDHRERATLALLNMHNDPEGRQILDRLRIDRFILPPKDWFLNFNRIENMTAFVQGKVHGPEKP